MLHNGTTYRHFWSRSRPNMLKSVTYFKLNVHMEQPDIRRTVFL
jgi:hypothetical protein